jgi:hypothetical protein
VSLTFTFKNGTGSKSDKKGKCSSQTFSLSSNSQKIKGVALEHQINDIPTTYGIGCLEKVRLSHSLARNFGCICILSLGKERESFSLKKKN